MNQGSFDRLETLLERSLPDLVREEIAQKWTQQWIGQPIESYLIEELIGTGTHGIVFRARRTSPFEQVVAIKVLPYLRGQAKIEQFRRECQALADLEHPNISSILTAGVTSDGTPYLVMPFLPGVPIDDFVDRAAEDWIQVAELMRQLAQAVAFAHERGVVHCDLKPDNVLVDQDGRVTVTDFGLAVRIDEMNDLAMRPSWAPGTIGYAAPEILTSRDEASPAVDLYSLGAVLYRLLTGQPPHRTSGWLDALVATAEADPEPVRVQNPRIPEKLASICDRCLNRTPEHRFSSAAELDDQLVEFIQVAMNSRHRRRRLRSGLGLFAALGFLLLPMLFWPPHQTTRMLGQSFLWQTSPPPISNSDAKVMLETISEEFLRPGMKYAAQPGDLEARFEILKKGMSELQKLLARAPNNKEVRHRTATAHFLLGRSARYLKKSEFADRHLALSEKMFRELHREYPDDGFMFDFFHTIIAQLNDVDHRVRHDMHFIALAVVERLFESDSNNLDYSDALACILNALAEDYSKEFRPDLLDLDKAEQHARRANEIAEWTCRQSGSLPIHRKHIMESLSTLGEIARLRGLPEQSLELAEVALEEAIRLNDAMQILDTKHQQFAKTVKYAIALRDVGRVQEAKTMVEEASRIVQQLSQANWPTIASNSAVIKKLKRSLSEPARGPVLSIR